MSTTNHEAAHLVFRDFSACVRVDGVPLTVYAPEYDEQTKTATGWIASEPGAEYTISWRRLKDVGSDAAADVYLDGHTRKRTCGGGLVRRYEALETWGKGVGVRVGPTAIRPLMFAQLQTTDDPELLASSSAPPQPGTILLKIYRVTTGPVYSERSFSDTPNGTSDSKFVHEKAKKLGCYITEFGQSRSVRASGWVPVKTYSADDRGSYVKFEFRYRSAEIRRAMDIMPGPQRNKRQRDDAEDVNDGQVPRKDNGIEADDPHIAILQAAITARKAALASRSKKRVKREDAQTSTRSQVATYLKPHEIIDLTLDD